MDTPQKTPDVNPNFVQNNTLGGWGSTNTPKTGGLEPNPNSGYRNNTYPFFNGDPATYPYTSPTNNGGSWNPSPIQTNPSMAPLNPTPLMPGETPTYPPGTGGLEPNQAYPLLPGETPTYPPGTGGLDPNPAYPLLPGENPSYPPAPVNNPATPLMPGETPQGAGPISIDGNGVSGPGLQVDGGTYYTPPAYTPPAYTPPVDTTASGGIPASAINMNGPQTSSTQAVLLARMLGMM